MLVNPNRPPSTLSELSTVLKNASVDTFLLLHAHINSALTEINGAL